MKYLPSLPNVYITQAVSCLVPSADHLSWNQGPVSAAQCRGPEAGTPCTMNTTNYTGSCTFDNPKMLSSLQLKRSTKLPSRSSGGCVPAQQAGGLADLAAGGGAGRRPLPGGGHHRGPRVDQQGARGGPGHTQQTCRRCVTMLGRYSTILRRGAYSNLPERHARMQLS